MRDEPLYTFEISLHRRPEEGVTAAADHRDGWGTWPTVALPHSLLAEPLQIAFEAALERLGGLDRMYAEPDGSFVWTGLRDGISWQVDGNVFDRNGRVVLVDLKGSCPPADFDRLLGCFGWPDEAVLFQLVRPAVFLEETPFRRHASARAAAESLPP